MSECERYIDFCAIYECISPVKYEVDWRLLFFYSDNFFLSVYKGITEKVLRLIDTYMSEFVINQEAFDTLCYIVFVRFPADELFVDGDEINWKSFFLSKACQLTFVLNASKTEVALPVQLIRIRPKHLAGCAKPKRASTLAPAPSPKPMTYLTCKKSSTVTKSSPSIWNEGYWKLLNDKYSLIIVVIGVERKIKNKEKSHSGWHLRIWQCFGIVCVSRGINMNKTWAFLNFCHTGTTNKILERRV